MTFSKYNDASLILVPAGYKAGVVYSQIPTDGNGDLTFVRGTTRDREDSTGATVSVAANVPALDYSLAGDCPALSIVVNSFRILP